jgi:hypothetical protein
MLEDGTSRGYSKKSPDGMMGSWIPGFQIILSILYGGSMFVAHRATATKIAVHGIHS